jgi:nucleoside-diphosphate-sugar epimerase
MKMLVTGGTGNVGRAVVARLLDEEHTVTVTGRREGVDAGDATYVACEVSDLGRMRELMVGCDAVIHLVGIVPVARPGYEVIRVNVLGTFGVFELAANLGIARVVAASSINATGCCYGDSQLALRYLPIDEEHPVQATDAYSLSKQEMETIGRYFWERDRVSNVMIRIPAVPSHDAVLAGPAERRRYDDAMVDRLLAMGDDELTAEMVRLTSVYNRFRRSHRADAIERGDWVTDDKDLTRDELHFMDQWRNWFTYCDELDSAQAFVKAATAEYEGSHALFINATANALGRPLEEVAGLYPCRPEIRARRAGDESLVSVDRARALIGFEPEWRMP